MVLGSMPSRRLIKLDRRSPAMAIMAMSAPRLQPSPVNCAASAVLTTLTRMRLIVFERPNTGRPSVKRRSRSTGSDKVSHISHFASNGLPLAIVTRKRTCATGKKRSLYAQAPRSPCRNGFAERLIRFILWSSSEVEKVRSIGLTRTPRNLHRCWRCR
jgi:hypothetical protein